MSSCSWARRIGALGAALAIALTIGVQPAGADGRPGGDDRARAGAAVDAMMGFYDAETGRWDPSAPWWQSGNALQALLDRLHRRHRLVGAGHDPSL